MQLYLNHLSPLEAEGSRLARHPEVAAALAAAPWFRGRLSGKLQRGLRVAVCQGRAEVVYRQYQGGDWEHSSEYVDKIFGHIKQSFRPVRAAA
jgi:hypothetical protein